MDVEPMLKGLCRQHKKVEISVYEDTIPCSCETSCEIIRST
jgi:hypothetical protein